MTGSRAPTRSPTCCRSRTSPASTTCRTPPSRRGRARRRRRSRPPPSRPATFATARAARHRPTTARSSSRCARSVPGRVILIGSDLATDDFRGWPGAPRLWSRLPPANAALEQFFGGGVPDPPGDGERDERRAQHAPRPRRPARRAAAGRDRRLHPAHRPDQLLRPAPDRPSRAGLGHRPAARRAVQRVLVRDRPHDEGRRRAGERDLGHPHRRPRAARPRSTRSPASSRPTGRTYDLTVEADALIGQLARTDGLPAPERRRRGRPGRAGPPARADDPGLRIRGRARHRHRRARCRPLGRRGPPRDGEVVGTVTNTSDVAIDDVAYISSTGGERIGDLAPGASAEFSLPGANFNGSSAADQVYGFGGFDAATRSSASSPCAARSSTRSSGYASFGPVNVDVGRRGPYVIGWRDDPGPMPVTIDNLQAQVYRSSVEVLSVRPALATGEVTIAPASDGRRRGRDRWRRQTPAAAG